MKKIVITVCAIGVVALGAYYIFVRNANAAQSKQNWQSFTVGRETIVSEVSATGVVEAENELNLSFRTPGRIMAVYVEEGNIVDTGQLLAELNTDDLDLQEKQAEIALEIAEAQLAKAKAGSESEDITAARASLDAAQAAYDRLLQGPTEEQRIIAEAQIKKAEMAVQQAQTAYDQVKWIGGVAALQPSLALQSATLDYEAAQANYNTQIRPAEAKDIKALGSQVAQAQAQLARLERGPSEEDLKILNAQVEQARISLEQIKLQKDNARLVAPFKGLVASVSAKEGQIASVGLPAVTLLDTNKYHITVNVDETDVGQLQPGFKATVQPESFPGLNLNGHVSLTGAKPVSQEGSAQSLLGGGGVVQYPVRIEVDDDFTGLKQGMTTQVIIEIAKYENVLVLPNIAVQVDKATGLTYVEKMIDGVPTPVEVILGIAGDGVTQVLAGVSEGDTVVLRAVSTREQLMTSFGPQSE